MRSLLTLLLVALAAGGCASAGALGDDPARIVGPTWQLVAMGSDAATAGAALTFDADGSFSGTTGCNRFFGRYDLASTGALTLSGIGSTRMACPPTAMTQESRILGALDGIDRVVLRGDELALATAGEPQLSFRYTPGPAAIATLTGTVTYRPRIALPPDAVATVQLLDVSLADAPSVTLAEQTIAPERLRVPFPFDLRYDAGRIDARHRYVVRAQIRDRAGALLWTTDTAYRVLTNGAPSDGVEVRLVQVAGDAPGGTASAGTLVGPEWQLVQIRSASGGAVEPEGDGGFSVSFSADGRFSGRADCNQYGGTFSAAGNGDLVLTNPVTTLAACAPPSSSLAFFGVVNRVVGYGVEGGRLTLRGADGGALVFDRSGVGDAHGMLPQETLRDTAYTCESPGGPFTVRTRTGPGELAVWLPARFAGRDGDTYLVLGQVRAASGAKYQDGLVTVWTKGLAEALIEVDGETFTDCQAGP